MVVVVGRVRVNKGKVVVVVEWGGGGLMGSRGCEHTADYWL